MRAEDVPATTLRPLNGPHPVDEVVLLVGGRSTEHDASLHSYRAVLEALSTRGHPRPVAVYYIDRVGQPYRHDREPWPLSEPDLRQGAPLSRPQLLEELAVRPPSFSLLHGNEGEDGAWQGVAEVLDLKGSFGPVLAAALSMNKWALGIIAAHECEGELRLPATWRITRHSVPADYGEIVERLEGAPCIIKPNRMGASLLAAFHGAIDERALRAEVSRLLPYDSEVLVQEHVRGLEYSVGVLARGGMATALPVLEIRPRSDFLSFGDKHSQHRAVASVVDPDTRLTVRLRSLSERIFNVVEFSTMCRFDYIVSGEGEVFFLEANALPGLASGSLYPKMLAAAGLDLADLVAASIEEAELFPRREKVLPYDIHPAEDASPR